MGSVPSDLDKNKDTQMEEDDNSTSTSRTMEGPSSRIEEMEEDDEPEPTSKAAVTVLPSSPPKNQDQVDNSSSDSVNLSDIPMEGPQEIEQEEEKDVEPQQDENDKLSIPVTMTINFDDHDHDHTYSAVSSPDIQACSIIMETGEPATIPELLPESTIEVGTSSAVQIPPTPPAPPPSKAVEDELLITKLKNEVTRLEAELTLERSSKQELSSQLLQSQTQFTQLTTQLTEAASIIIEQQKVVSTVGEKESLLESLQSNLLKERQEKSEISQKYEKQQRSLVTLTKEVNEIFEELQTHFANCCKPKQQNEMDPSNMSWMSNQQLQNKLDQLTASVQERYQFWTTEQRKMEQELNDTRKTMEELIELLEGMEENTTPNEKPPQKNDLQSRPPTQQDDLEHGKDPSKKLLCFCGQKFFSESALRNHIKRLTGELKYICKECSMGFVFPSDLSLHLKSKHKRSTVPPPKNAVPPPKTKRIIWSCEFCDNSFLKADIYRIHVKTCKNATAGTSTADSSPPPISSVTSSPPSTPKFTAANPHQEDSSDDDITILEDDSTFNPPSISIPLRQPTNPTPSSVPPVMSRVAQLYMSSSPISFLPTPPPAPLPPGIIKVVQHPPIPTTTSPSTTTTSFTSKKHCRDITKRHIGFFCICGIKFISRKRLDGHLTFRNGRINGATSHRNWNPLTLAQIKKEKATSSSSSSSSQPQILGGNFKKNLKNIPTKRGGGRPKSKKKHGVDPTNSLACLCGKSEKSVARLLRHIRYHTATKTIPCEYCDKLFLTNSFLNRHYKTNHQVEMMTAQSLSAPVKSSKKISKPKKTAPSTSSTAAASATSTPAVQVHRLDYSKSHRGNFCKCGRKFGSKRKLNIHLYRKNTEGDGDGGGGEEVEGVEDTENSLDMSWKKQVNSKGSPAKAAAAVAAVAVPATGGISSILFTCTTCGEKFTSNVDRIRHRVQAHGHGLF